MRRGNRENRDRPLTEWEWINLQEGLPCFEIPSSPDPTGALVCIVLADGRTQHYKAIDMERAVEGWRDFTALLRPLWEPRS